MWILNCGGTFTCGIFETKEDAEKVIKKYKLNGTLTKYPTNTLIYDWSIENGYFTPKNEWQKTSEFIGSFSSAYQEHYYYDDDFIFNEEDTDNL